MTALILDTPQRDLSLLAYDAHRLRLGRKDDVQARDHRAGVEVAYVVGPRAAERQAQRAQCAPRPGSSARTRPPATGRPSPQRMRT